MAANSKVREVSHSFKQRLELLGCPYTEGVDDSWIAELVFSPGEARIRVLQWLFSRFDSTLANLLDPQHASRDLKMDSRIQRLLYVASTVCGLCKPDDADLIRGVGSKMRQIAFMDTLLDLVCIMDASDDPASKAMHSPGIVSSGMTLEEQFQKDCWYMDSLVSTCNMEHTFTTKAKLLPPDIMKTLERAREEKGDTQGSPGQLPDLTRLEQMAEQLSKDLESHQHTLSQLQHKHPVPSTDHQTLDKVSRTLRLVLSELSQLVVGFSYCFENEMRPWCNRSAPRLNQLGPAFKRVHTMLQQFTQLLQSLANIKDSHTSLTTDMPSRVEKITQNQDQQGSMSQGMAGLAMVGQSALESFQDCVSILEESLVRSNMTANSPDSTFNASVIQI